jgi:hypothetical protein
VHHNEVVLMLAVQAGPDIPVQTLAHLGEVMVSSGTVPDDDFLRRSLFSGLATKPLPRTAVPILHKSRKKQEEGAGSGPGVLILIERPARMCSPHSCSPGEGIMAECAEAGGGAEEIGPQWDVEQSER